jgi:hypothetical protein
MIKHYSESEVVSPANIEARGPVRKEMKELSHEWREIVL